MAEWKVKGKEVVADMVKAVKEEYGESIYDESESVDEPIVTQTPKSAEEPVPLAGEEESNGDDPGKNVSLVNSMDASSLSV